MKKSKLTEAELHAKYTAITNEAVAEAETFIANATLEAAIGTATEAVADALDTLRSCAFGVADSRTSALHRERQKLVAAKTKYADALLVLRQLEKFQAPF